MFFKEKIFYDDIIIPRIFFEQIIPLSPPGMVKVYLYGYFLAYDETEELKDNSALADKLNMNLEDVLDAWEFYEACGIIKRHYVEGTNDFSVEFLDFSRTQNKKKSKRELSTQELMLISHNEEHKKMLDQIEGIISTFLTPEDIRKIENFIQEYNIQKAVVVEAFSFAVEKKKSRTVKVALGIARTWYLDGVRSVEDLETHQMQRGNRYKEYKRVLGFLGEYRTPTKAEEEIMDKWLDEYKFSIEVIEEACKRTLGIKSPNITYIDGILKNWDKEAEKMDIKPANKFQDKDPTVYRLALLDKLSHKGKTLTKEERGYLKSIYDSYSLEDALIAVDSLSKTSDSVTLSCLYDFLYSPTREKGTKLPENKDNSKINLSEIEGILNKKSPRSELKDKKDAVNIEKRKKLLAKARSWEDEV